jgi:hypothetical protein
LDRGERLALLSRDDEAALGYAARIPEQQVFESWQLIEPSGVRMMHGAAAIRLLEYLPATRWVAWVGINVRTARRASGSSLASTLMASVDVEHDLASECVRIIRRP